MAKIAFFELEDWEKDYVRERLQGHELKFYSKELAEENVGEVSDCEALGIFIYSFITPEILEKIQNVKIITTMSTGFDHINVGECKNKGIVVCNVPSYGENTVAEHTMALILSVSRKIPWSLERTKKGDFSLDGLRGFDLKGKTIGVVGTGKIGRHVIRMAKGFEMNVIAYDPFPNYDTANQMGFQYVGFDELLSRSDIITLHAPLNEHTYHLINSGNINKIKKGAVLVNTARGGLVETDALVKAVESKILSAVGLDVLEEEFFVKEEKQLLAGAFKKECDLKTVLEEHILLDQDNVIITPHNAFNSEEALKRILDTTISNIQKFFEGKAENTVG